MVDGSSSGTTAAVLCSRLVPLHIQQIDGSLNHPPSVLGIRRTCRQLLQQLTTAVQVCQLGIVTFFYSYG
jgi:hypothetical protein